MDLRHSGYHPVELRRSHGLRRLVRYALQLFIQSEYKLRERETLARVSRRDHEEMVKAGVDNGALPGSMIDFKAIADRYPGLVTFSILIRALSFTTHDCTMYGYSVYGEPPSTPSRSSRSQSQPTPATPRASVTTTHTGPGDAGNGNPALITYTTISQEYASLRYPGHCPLGMYLIPDKDSLFVWDGVFFVHQGSSPTYLPASPASCDD